MCVIPCKTVKYAKPLRCATLEESFVRSWQLFHSSAFLARADVSHFLRGRGGTAGGGEGMPETPDRYSAPPELPVFPKYEWPSAIIRFHSYCRIGWTRAKQQNNPLHQKAQRNCSDEIVTLLNNMHFLHSFIKATVFESRGS